MYKNYDKDKQLSYLMYLDVNLYGWRMSQNLPVDGFGWKKYICQNSMKIL